MQFTETETKGIFVGNDGIEIVLAVEVTVEQAVALKGSGTVRYTQEGKPVVLVHLYS
jgi:hypothetical protein